MNRVFSFIGFALLAFSWGNVYGAKEVELNPDQKEQVRQVIGQQLDAFRKSDFQTAFGFAHQGLKAQMTQAQFEQMVRGDFSIMLAPGDTVFGEVKEDGNRAAANVLLRSKDGELSAFQYILEKDAGAWRITAVIPLELEESEMQA